MLASGHYNPFFQRLLFILCITVCITITKYLATNITTFFATLPRSKNRT